MPQLAVTQNAILAQPGMLLDGQRASAVIESAVAAVNIPFGVLCEFLGGSTGTQKTVQPVQDANLAGTVTVTNASAAITFSQAQTLPQGQPLVFSDQPGVVYYLAAAINAGTAGTLTQNYSGTGGAGKLTRLAPYAPQLAGISEFNPLAVEQSYVSWAVPTVLAGTVAVTNGSKNVTFSQNQTLAQGTMVTFASQPGVPYFLAAAINAGTAGVLTAAYGGATAGATTATLPQAGSSVTGYKAGTSIPLVRRGIIWGASDGGGTPTQTGPINVWHSSTGANPQGVFTFSAASMTVGGEIDVAPSCQAYNPGVSYSAQQTDPFGNVFFVTPVSINV